jgi:hypothetical protein
MAPATIRETALALVHFEYVLLAEVTVCSGPENMAVFPNL